MLLADEIVAKESDDEVRADEAAFLIDESDAVGVAVEKQADVAFLFQHQYTPVSLMPVGVFSEPGRDPRGWIISNAFASIISEESVKQIGGDDASDAQWFDVWFEQREDGNDHLVLCYDEIKLNAVLTEEETRFGKTTFKIKDSGNLAFDHAGIIATALTALRESAKNYETIFDFLPEKFTLTQLQKVQETIMNISILPANFRRKISDYVVETDEYTQGAGHRPAKLYRRK